jgi:hypothetical protein
MAEPSAYRLWVQARDEHGFGTDSYDYDAADKRWKELMTEHGLD